MSSKKSRLSLYADECIPIPSVTYLKRKGISIIHAYDINFLEQSDNLQFKKSKQLKRILISLDKDFKRFKDLSLKGHPGIILLSTGDITSGNINKILNKMLKYLTENFVKESLIKATVDKITREKNGVLSEKLL